MRITLSFLSSRRKGYFDDFFVLHMENNSCGTLILHNKEIELTNSNQFKWLSIQMVYGNKNSIITI